MDPQIAALLPILEADTAGRLDALERDIAAVRAQRNLAAEATQGQGPEIAHEEDRTIPGPAGEIPVRVFVPHGAPVGAYLHIHGGGWVLGSERNQDPMLRTIASEAGVVVVSVGYRLAPEHPYPAGLDDCVAAADWLTENAREFGLPDPEALGIGGESAGANLAAATLLRRRDHLAQPFRAAVLTFGVFSVIPDLPSMKRMWDRELVLSGPIMEFFTRCYADGRNFRSPYISPLFADLKGMPPAIFSVGTLDHLYSDTLLMAEAWRRAGNHSELHEYRDAPHGFIGFPLDIAEEANRRIAAFLRRELCR